MFYCDVFLGQKIWLLDTREQEIYETYIIKITANYFTVDHGTLKFTRRNNTQFVCKYVYTHSVYDLERFFAILDEDVVESYQDEVYLYWDRVELIESMFNLLDEGLLKLKKNHQVEPNGLRVNYLKAEIERAILDNV